jgi:multidrug efflux pump subunit AcrB
MAVARCGGRANDQEQSLTGDRGCGRSGGVRNHRQVAGPIERALSVIAGITSLTSTSALGISTIIIQFDLNRIDGAALDVQTALTVAARKLPVEMLVPPSFRKVNPADAPIIMFSLAAAIDGR